MNQNMLKIGFLLDDDGFTRVNCSVPELGNPGIGGTPYCFVAVASALVANGEQITIFHHDSTNSMPKGVMNRIVSRDLTDLDKSVNESGVDLLVVRAYNMANMKKIVGRLSRIPLIAWAHNHLSWKTLQFIGQLEQIKRVVFVGEEQRSLANDTICKFKGVTIQNPFSLPITYEGVNKCPNSAVYVGSLTPSKGFHRLAKLWPRVRESIVDARLEVIGSGALYDRRAQMGALGIAEANYENKILNYLSNTPEKYGVTFHGLLGFDRFKIISGCSVGIPNPTGLTECFPGTILEMSGCGLPVVTMRRWGACDTVLDNKTGLLSNNEKELVFNIVKLMKDNNLAIRIGKTGKAWVNNEFSFEKAANKWKNLFIYLEKNEYKIEYDKDIPVIKGKYWWDSVYKINKNNNNLLGNFRTLCTKIESWRLKR